MAEQNTIRLSDKVSLAIVEKHQREIGDKTPGRTLTRMVQAFEHSGMKLLPDATDPDATETPVAL